MLYQYQGLWGSRQLALALLSDEPHLHFSLVGRADTNPTNFHFYSLNYLLFITRVLVYHKYSWITH